jgi:hypothetical protein
MPDKKTMPDESVLAKEIIERMKHFEADRSNWDTFYEECADFGMPTHNQVISRQSPGERKPDLYDTTAEESNIQLSAGLYSFMFPTDGRAFVLEIEEEEFKEDDDVTQWLEEVTSRIHKHLVNSNFRQVFYEYLKSLGCFGTADMHVEEGKKRPLVFTNHYMADVFIALNSDRDVDTVFRRFVYTARQAAQEFGEENLGERVKKAFNSKRNRDKKFNFIHAIFPREDYDTGKDDPPNMPIASVYVCKEDKNIVSESGYNEMPDMVSFFDKDPREDLGRSPMMKKLPDIKMVNAMAKCRIKGWEKQVDPPIMTPADGSIWPLATQPGGVIHFRAGGDKPDYFEFKGDLSRMEDAIQTTQQNIQKGFFLDMFDPLVDRQNMTATEVMARVEQKMRFLTPIIGRLQSGLFNPMIQRIINILSRKGLLPEIPDQLKGAEYSVMYLGRLALAMKTLETEGLAKTLAEWAPLAGQNIVEWLDNLDMDQSFRDSFRNNGGPATWLKDVKERDLERAQRDLKQQQAEMIQAAPELAKAYKQGSGKAEEGSLSQEVIQNVA